MSQPSLPSAFIMASSVGTWSTPDSQIPDPGQNLYNDGPSSFRDWYNCFASLNMARLRSHQTHMFPNSNDVGHVHEIFPMLLVFQSGLAAECRPCRRTPETTVYRSRRRRCQMMHCEPSMESNIGPSRSVQLAWRSGAIGRG
jgi:hypothetical protein